MFTWAELKNNALNKNLSKRKSQKYEGSPVSQREYINVEDAALGSVEALKTKYKNKYIIITGNKKIKIIKLLKHLKNSLNLNTKIKFSSVAKSYLGHYVSNPFTYKPYVGKKLMIRKKKFFFKEVDKYLQNRKFI